MVDGFRVSMLFIEVEYRPQYRILWRISFSKTKKSIIVVENNSDPFPTYPSSSIPCLTRGRKRLSAHLNLPGIVPRLKLKGRSNELKLFFHPNLKTFCVNFPSSVHPSDRLQLLILVAQHASRALEPSQEMTNSFGIRIKPALPW